MPWDAGFRTDASKQAVNALFYGLGSDGTVSANKNSIKIIGDKAQGYAQGYFVYDSRKSGAVTVSHLRFGKEKIRSTYLIGNGEAGFIACHQPVFLERYRMLDKAAPGGVFLLNSSLPPDQVWSSLPRSMQAAMIEKKIAVLYDRRLRDCGGFGLGRLINTVMQACFFALIEIIPKDEAIAAIKAAAHKTYQKAGKRILDANLQAIDAALANLHRVEVPDDIPQSNRNSAAGAGRCARVYPERDRRNHRRSGRCGAGQLSVRRRHLSDRDFGLGQTQSGARNPGLGKRYLYPVRQMCVRLSAQRDPQQGFCTGTGREGAADIQICAGQKQGV